MDFNSLENDRSEGLCEIRDEALASGTNEDDDDFNEGELEEEEEEDDSNDGDDDDFSSLGPIF